MYKPGLATLWEGAGCISFWVSDLPYGSSHEHVLFEFHYRKRLFAGTPPVFKNLFAGTPPSFKNLFAGTPPVFKNLFAGTTPAFKNLFAGTLLAKSNPFAGIFWQRTTHLQCNGGQAFWPWFNHHFKLKSIKVGPLFATYVEYL